MAEAKTVAIDHISDKYLLYREKKARLEELTTEVGRLRDELEAEIGDAQEATIFGESVIAYPWVNKFKTGEFKKDNPVLYQRYVHPVVKEEFDVDKFRAEHPFLYGQYQGRQWMVKDK